LALRGLSSTRVNGVSLPIPVLRFRGFRVLQSFLATVPRIDMASILPVRPSVLPGPSGFRFWAPLRLCLISGCSSLALRRHRSVLALAPLPEGLWLRSTIEAGPLGASLERPDPSAYPEGSTPFFASREASRERCRAPERTHS
jgi:hypothetical protein